MRSLNVIQLYWFATECASTWASRCFLFNLLAPCPSILQSRHTTIIYPHSVSSYSAPPAISFLHFYVVFQCLQLSQKVSLYLPRPCSFLSIYDLSTHTCIPTFFIYLYLFPSVAKTDFWGEAPVSLYNPLCGAASLPLTACCLFQKLPIQPRLPSLIPKGACTKKAQ